MNCTSAVRILCAPLLLAACSSVPTGDIEIDAAADEKARFAGFKSYAWLAEAAILRDPEGHWTPPSFDADAEIKFLIDRELRGRGMTEESSEPDLFVVYAVGVDMEALKLKKKPDSEMDVLTKVPQGGLVIALVDARSGFVVWVGVAQGELQEDAEEATVKARLDYAVTHLLKKIPK